MMDAERDGLSKTPKPLELKRFYVLLALSWQPMHAYAIHEQTLTDSGGTLYFSFTSLRRVLEELVRRGFVEERDSQWHGSVEVPRYAVTAVGRGYLRMEAAALEQATRLARERLA